jgi:hypothetical protein
MVDAIDFAITKGSLFNVLDKLELPNLKIVNEKFIAALKANRINSSDRIFLNYAACLYHSKNIEEDFNCFDLFEEINKVDFQNCKMFMSYLDYYFTLMSFTLQKLSFIDINSLNKKNIASFIDYTRTFIENGAQNPYMISMTGAWKKILLGHTNKYIDLFAPNSSKGEFYDNKNISFAINSHRVAFVNENKVKLSKEQESMMKASLTEILESPEYFKMVAAHYKYYLKVLNLNPKILIQMNEIIPGYVDIPEGLSDLTSSQWDLFQSPTPLKAYILGFPIHLGVPSDDIVNEYFFKMVKMGSEAYMLEVGKEGSQCVSVKMMGIKALDTKENCLANNYEHYGPFDRVQFFENSHSYEFTRDEWNGFEKMINPTTRTQFPETFVQTIKARNEIAKTYNLPPCNIIKELIDSFSSSPQKNESVDDDLVNRLVDEMTGDYMRFIMSNRNPMPSFGRPRDGLIPSMSMLLSAFHFAGSAAGVNQDSSDDDVPDLIDEPSIMENVD